MKVVVSQNNAIGKVYFSKTNQIPSLALDSLTDVIITNPQANDGLVYDSTANKFLNKPISTTSIDGGTF